MDSKNKFFYTIISYQESLFEKDSSYPIAILVVSFAQKRVVVLGRKVNTDKIKSEISKRQIETYPKILCKNICKAIRESNNNPNEEQLFFDVITRENNWNTFISPVKIYEGLKNIEQIAFEYYPKYIESMNLEKEEDDISDTEMVGIENLYKQEIACEYC